MLLALFDAIPGDGTSSEGDPFYYAYDDIVLDVLSGGVLTDLESVGAFETWTETEWLQWEDANPEFLALEQSYEPYTPFPELGATPQQVGEIIARLG